MSTPIAQRPYGPDISSHNCYPAVSKDPDFQELKSSGCDFVFIKKDQGNYYNFAKYQTLCAQAKAAGLVVFDYHYLSYNSLPADQVPHYLNNRAVDTKPVVDFENWSDSGEGQRRGHDYMQAWCHDFILQIEAATGQYPIVYTYPGFYVGEIGNPTGEPFTDCPLWVADYRHPNQGPQVIGGWPYHTFWQYTSVGTLPGIQGVVDINRFNGNYSQLKAIAGGS